MRHRADVEQLRMTSTRMTIRDEGTRDLRPEQPSEPALKAPVGEKRRAAGVAKPMRSD